MYDGIANIYMTDNVEYIIQKHNKHKSLMILFVIKKVWEQVNSNICWSEMVSLKNTCILLHFRLLPSHLDTLSYFDIYQFSFGKSKDHVTKFTDLEKMSKAFL